ncbi:MAG: hypothetical protein PHF21_00380, partial [Bacilli bacterium]|nr:hypothetical protein [Bacilli bacterium]
MKRVILGIVFIILTFISVTFAVSAILLNSNKILNSFSIISVDNASNVYSVNFEKVKTAEYYDVLVYNEKNIPIYSKSIYKNNIQMTLDNIEYDSKYKIVIYAYNKLGDSIGVHNPYVFTYTEPTFDLNNSLVLKDNEDYKLQIKGKLNKKDYIIRIL